MFFAVTTPVPAPAPGAAIAGAAQSNFMWSLDKVRWHALASTHAVADGPFAGHAVAPQELVMRDVMAQAMLWNIAV